MITRPNPNNPKSVLEPYEEVTIETDMEYISMIIERLVNNRKGVLMEAVEQKDGRHNLTFKVPTRGLLGFRMELINDTRGTALMRT